jgi:hypothetical protein
MSRNYIFDLLALIALIIAVGCAAAYVGTYIGDGLVSIHNEVCK